MIIKLKNADFSANNIGALSSWRIVKSLKGVTTDSNVVNVDKDASYSAVFNVSEGYTFNNAVVTMGGNDISSNLVWNTDKTVGTLTISNVTGNIYISIIADAPVDDEETKQYTITYRYITLSERILKPSTSEKVDEGTFKKFSINNAPEIEYYKIKEVSPTSATVNGDIIVNYIYESINSENFVAFDSTWKQFSSTENNRVGTYPILQVGDIVNFKVDSLWDTYKYAIAEGDKGIGSQWIGGGYQTGAYTVQTNGQYSIMVARQDNGDISDVEMQEIATLIGKIIY